MRSFALLAVLLATSPLLAQAKKYALLVGVNKYQHADLNKPEPLQYAEADVRGLKELLEKSGYTVTLLTGEKATLSNIRDGISELRKKGSGSAMVLAAFAGHGIQPEDSKDAYFCPYDADQAVFDRDGKKVADWDLKNSMLPLSEVIVNLKASGADSKAILVDACRNDPKTGRGRGFGTEFNVGDLPDNLALMLSCSKGERAWEDKAWDHGAFFYHVLKGLAGDGAVKGHVTANSLAAYVARAVRTDVPAVVQGGATQRPHAIINGEVDFLIAPGKIEPANPRILRERESKLDKEFECLVYDLGKDVELKLVRVSAKGKRFTGGSSKVEQASVLKKYFNGKRPEWMKDEDERDTTFVDDHYVGQFEVTRGQFRRFVEDTGYKTEIEQGGGGYGLSEFTSQIEGPDKQYTWKNPGFSQSDDHPVVNVTGKDAEKFCEWLTKKKDAKVRLSDVRLPSEAEWEYACRGGENRRFSFGDDDEMLAKYGNVADGTARAKFPTWPTIQAEDGYVFTAPVGKFKPNAYGLYDMHGNAWEWCKSDEYVLRGGSWGSNAGSCRSAIRIVGAPAYRFHYLYGFRVAVSR